MVSTTEACNKAIKYIHELQEYTKDSERDPSVFIPTFNEDDDEIVSLHIFYIKEMFALKYIYESLLKDLQNELDLKKYAIHGPINGEGIIPDIQKWKDAIQIIKHQTLPVKKG